MCKYGVFSCPYFPLFGLNTGKYGPEKLLICTIFTQCMDQAITASEKTVWSFFKWFTEIQMKLSFDLFYSVINNVHERQTKLGPENLIKLEMKNSGN